MVNYKAPFFFKIRFYQPDPVNQEKNSKHIKYIGTRPGVELGTPSLELENQNDQIEFQRGSAAHHIKYAHERPRSHGLFSSGNEEVDMKEIQDELKNHKGMVWRLIVSLHGEDAERLEMDNREAWEEVIKQQLPRACDEMGIAETNLRWVAAFHAEVGHPHAHIVFWEKKPKRRMGTLTPEVKDGMKKKFVQKIYAEDRDRLAQEKNHLRDYMKEQGVENLRDAVNLARDYNLQKNIVKRWFSLTGRAINGLVVNPDLSQTILLKKMLEELSDKLPGHGRIMLKFMPANVKAEIRKIAEWLYNEPQFAPLRAEYEKIAENYAKPYTHDPEKLEEAKQNAREDIYTRIGQMILKASVEINKKNHFAINDHDMSNLIKKFETADGKIVDNKEERLFKKIMNKFIVAGLPKSTFIEILNKFSWSEEYLASLDIDKKFKVPIVNKKITKDTLYTLTAFLGITNAEELVNQVGYGEKEIEVIRSFEPEELKPNLIELGKRFKVTDHIRSTIMQFARTMKALGIDNEQAASIIENWLSRSGTKADFGIAKRFVWAADQEYTSKKEWGNVLGMDKRQFLNMCKKLNIENVEYPFLSAVVMKARSKSISTRLFKGSLGQMESNIKKMEAENEHKVAMYMNRIRQQAEQEQEKKERGNSR